MKKLLSVLLVLSLMLLFSGCGQKAAETKETAALPERETSDILPDGNQSENQENEPLVSVEFPRLSAGDPVPEDCCYETAAGEILKPGTPMPEAVQEGDVFRSRQFVYTCRMVHQSFLSPNLVPGWAVTFNIEHVNPGAFTEFTEIMYEEVNGLQVLSLNRGFANMDALGATPPIPDSVTDMGGAFLKCLSLEKVSNFPGELRDLTACFHGCVSLKSVPALPEHTEMMNYAFQFCEKLTKTPDYSGCPELRGMDGSFQNCFGLQSAARIPENVTSLSETFKGCAALEGKVQIDAGNLVVSNCRDTFEGCSNLILKGNAVQETLEALAKTGREITAE